MDKTTRNPWLSDSVPLDVVYRPTDDASVGSVASELPGQFPFTRGVQPDMYQGRLWTMRQYAGFGDAKATNARFQSLLAKGQTGLSVAFDLPTQMGRDPDHPEAVGEVGRVGVSIAHLDDMRELLENIRLVDVSTSMTINATAAILLGLYVVVAEEHGVDSKTIRGTIQNDILKEYIARGTYIYPPGPSLRLTRDIFAWCSEFTPKWNVISVSGYHMREAGCTATQEVAFTLADAITYVQLALEAGIAVDHFGRQLSFFFNAHNHVLEEVAKYRAARRMWARIMKERFGAKDAKACMLRFHAQTAGSSLQAQQPLVNAIRTAYQGLSAVLGGCQSLHTNSFDEALGLPTEESATLALRTQQVLAYESGAADTADALGGSWAIEQLTARIEKDAQALIDAIEKMGGMVKAIEAGYVQREIELSAYRYQMEVERKERLIVGVNAFTESLTHHEAHLHTLDPEAEQRQVQKLKAFRAKRDTQKAVAACHRLTQAAETQANLMPLVVDAIRAQATLGEISAAMELVFGKHRAG